MKFLAIVILSAPFIAFGLNEKPSQISTMQAGLNKIFACRKEATDRSDFIFCSKTAFSEGPYLEQRIDATLQLVIRTKSVRPIRACNDIEKKVSIKVSKVPLAGCFDFVDLQGVKRHTFIFSTDGVKIHSTWSF